MRPVAIKHSVPTVGYAVRQGDHSFFFSSDTGGGCHDAWLQVRPDVLITETTLPDRLQAAADQFDHLTPAKLAHELRDFRALHGYLPRVIVVHVDPKHEPEVRAEIAAVARTLEATIEVGYEGMEVTL